MGGVATGQGANKLDTELNLVPFIDLLSTLVLFLLITAVWMQVSAIQASVASKGKSSTSVVEQTRLTVHLTPGGYRLTWPSSVPGPAAIGKLKGAYDSARLAAVIAKSAQAARVKNLVVAVSADDQIDYGFVIEAVDYIKGTTGQTVALATN